MTFLTKNKLKLVAAQAYVWSITEDNRTSGFDIYKRDRLSMLSYRARKVLKNRHNIDTDLDAYDNLTFKERG